MCLESAKKITPKKDIICYKVLCFGDDGKYVSPQRMTEYRIGKLKTLRRETPDTTSRLVYSSKKGNLQIHGGAYHSYANIGAARDGARFLSLPEIRMRSLIVECKIPKTCKYVYEGRFFGFKGYASQQIKPLKVVTIYEFGKPLHVKKEQ